MTGMRKFFFTLAGVSVGLCMLGLCVALSGLVCLGISMYGFGYAGLIGMLVAKRFL